MCDRTQLSATGFVSRSAAASWFPEQIPLIIDGRIAKIPSAEGVVTPDGNRLRIDFRIEDRTISIRFFPKNLRASAWMEAPSGYVPTTPSRYQCRIVEGLEINS